MSEPSRDCLVILIGENKFTAGPVSSNECVGKAHRCNASALAAYIL